MPEPTLELIQSMMQQVLDGQRHIVEKLDELTNRTNIVEQRLSLIEQRIAGIEQRFHRLYVN